MYALSIAAIGIVTLVVIRFSFGVYVNTSSSVDGTLFYSIPYEQGSPDQYVVLCPDHTFSSKYNLIDYTRDAGNCGGSIPLLKRIIAYEYDYLVVNNAGISVNEADIPGTSPKPLSSANTQLQPFNYRGLVPSGYLAVIGDTADSFDSRYFGLVKESWIISAANIVF